MFKKAAFLAAVATSLVTAIPAFADTKLKGVDLKPWNSPYASGPMIDVKRNKAGKLYIASDHAYVPIRVGGRIDNTSKKYKIFAADIFVQSIFGKGQNYSIMPRNLGFGEGVRSINDNKTLYFANIHLGYLTKHALDRCADYTGNQVKSFPLQFPMTITVKAGKSYFGGFEQIVTKEASTEIGGSVRCPAAVEDAPDRSPVSIAVKSAKLAIVNGVTTTCPRTVFLVGTFETNKAGTFDVILRRNDGESLRRTVKAEKKGGKFVAKLDRTYKIADDVSRKYMVEVVGQAKASAWVPMRVVCDGPAGRSDKNGLKLN